MIFIHVGKVRHLVLDYLREYKCVVWLAPNGKIVYSEEYLYEREYYNL